MSDSDGTTTENCDASGGESQGLCPQTSHLNVSRDRDAWKTIRGFGYQIALTVERWLRLTHVETLELENGEDIDRITPSLVNDEEVSARVLEQVKHLDANVTLRNGACLEALGNAVDHLEQNPGKELYFQFTTTAEVGLEQKSPLKPERGIEVWEKLRIDKNEVPDNVRKVEYIRDLVLSGSQPPQFPDPIWAKHLKFWKEKSVDEILLLICRFTWLTGQADLAIDWARIDEAIIGSGFADNQSDARNLTNRLIAAVLQKLSVKGRKTLTAGDLKAAIANASLDPLGGSFSLAMNRRVSNLEIGLRDVRHSVQEIQKKFEVPELILKPPRLILEVPPQVDPGSPREEVISNLIASLTNCVWLAIYGPVLSGKTELVIRICDKLPSRKIWLRLQGSTIKSAAAQIDLMLERLSIGSQYTEDLSELARNVFSTLGQNSLVILDGLPRFSLGDELAERLLLMFRSAATLGVHLISTSHERIPATFAGRLPAKQFVSFPAPVFSETDTRDLLLAAGASEGSLRYAEQLQVLGREHPVIIAALVNHLKRRGWEFSMAWFESALKGDHSKELDDETLSRIVSTIEDVENREFLYRLTLITGAFGSEEVQAVSEAAPVLSHPIERVRLLVGPWIRKDTDGKMQLSPLVEKLGSGNLLPQVAADCHRRLARAITARPELTTTKLLAAFMHSVQGDELSRAALFLAQGLSASIGQGISDPVFGRIWSEKELPDEIPLSLKVYLRSLQIVSRLRWNLSVSFLIDDLFTLLPRIATEENWTLAVVAAVAGPAIVQADPSRGFALLGEVLRLSDKLRDSQGNAFVLPGAIGLEALLWMSIEGITSEEHIRQWVALFKQLIPEQRIRAEKDALGPIGCLMVPIRLIVQEQNRPVTEQDWNTVDSTLEWIATEALALGSELLWASAIRARILVISECHHRLTEAVALGEKALQTGSENPTVRFIICAQVGEQLYGAPSRRSDAQTWLQMAVEQATPHFPDIMLSVLQRLSWIIGNTNTSRAVELLGRAVQLAESCEEIPILDHAVALGELAVAYWLANEISSALEAWDRATRRLFEARSDSDEWRAAVVIFGHVGGFFAALAQFGSPPQFLPNGDAYPPPFRGMISTRSPELHTLYRSDHEVFLQAHCTMIAETKGDHSGAAYWTRKALDCSRTGQRSIALAKVNLENIPTLIDQSLFGEALQVSLDAGIVMVGARLAGDRVIPPDFDFEATLGDAPNAHWAKAESEGAQSFLNPVAFHLFLLFLTSPEEARRQSSEVARLCREQASHGINRDLWIVASQLFGSMFEATISAKHLVRKGVESAQKQVHEITLLFYLAASLAPDATVVESFQAHTSVVKSIENRLTYFFTFHRDLVLPFFFQFWEARFNRSRFGFSQPGLVEKEIVEAKGLPAGEQLRKLFQGLGRGLRSAVPPEIATWLELQ